MILWTLNKYEIASEKWCYFWKIVKIGEFYSSREFLSYAGKLVDIIFTHKHFLVHSFFLSFIFSLVLQAH